MINHADRYTVLKIDARDFAAHIDAAAKLGLHWFAEKGDLWVRLYLFFDWAGMENYKTGQYGNVADSIRALIETATPDTVPGDVLKAIATELGI